MNNWYISSSGEGLSLTIKGALMAIVPLIILWAQTKGIPLSESQLVEGIESITQAIAAVAVVYGLARKVWYWLKR